MALTKPAGCFLQTMGALFLVVGFATLVPTSVESEISYGWGIGWLLLAGTLLYFGRAPSVTQGRR